MRLSVDEIEAIKRRVYRYDSSARIFLFGSPADDTARGGDIDLLLESAVLDFSSKISILVDLKGDIGEQKIDIVLTQSLESDPNRFIQAIRKKLVAL